MEDMNADSLPDKSLSVSRVHSQELLDSSSASSLSVFADHTDGHNSSFKSNDVIVQAHKSDGNSPRASMDEALKSEAAFIQYVMSIPPKESCEHHQSADSMTSRSKASPGVAPAVSKVGLDHLDNLCKLMEQLSELRDTNSKLQKRVQYLEDLKTLHDMHKEICEGGEYSSEDALEQKPEPYKLKKSATETHCVKEEDSSALGSSRSPSRYLSRRSRSQQTGTQRRGRSKSVGHEDLGEDPKSRRLFPKWSKVKEAFGWESERKGSIKVKDECESILTPRRRSDESRQMYRHPGSPTWYQQCPSIHSSIGEIDVDFEEERWKKMSVVSEKYISHLDTPHEGLRRQKSTPSPGSDKVASYRESTELKAKASTIERDSYRNQDFSKFDKEECKRGKSPWGRVKTIIERHRDSLKRRSLRRDQPVMDCEASTGKNQPDSLDFKIYSDYLESASKQPSKHKGCKPAPIVLEPDDCSGLRTPCSSPNFQRKSRWNRMTKVWKGKKEGERDHQSLSTPTSPNNNQDGNFTFDIIEEISPDSYVEGRELSRVGSDSHVHQLALAVSSSDLMLQLQRNLSEDFHRKIQEWERIRSSGITSQSPNWDHKPSDAPRNRKKSERDDKGIKPKIKDLTWLEKELQKIEKEKQRLSKERQKYEERALRLEKLKETVLSANNSNKREVLVRTSAGEFRFEGISDAFTKKLYEWETKRGVGPELSTIALLDSSRLLSQSGSGSKVGLMQRVLSRSESSIADIGQPSHNSSNSLPSVKLPDSSEADRQNHTSRANSEPDLTALVAYANGNNLSVSKSARMVTDTCDVDITSPAASKESEEEDFDRGRKGSESYFGLLEENVILLDQLKEKEDICRRLEKDLEILDEKMDEMHSHHVQETQRYREKLWEMHQQGASPRDVQGCRHTMMQLRKRIEYLESWTEKLRSERETVEVNFRHHSKEQETMTLDLLEKMRELQAAGSSTKDCCTRRDSQLDSSTIERLQDLSALLTKQTQDLEETLSHKTRQICQLKWELLNRDLSSVKKETEQHTHTAHKKRSKYAQWRSRSSEEAPATTCTPKTDDPDYVVIATKFYCNASPPEDEFKATHLANTVQELNREVLKLTSGTSVSSFTKYLEDKGVYPSAPASTKNSENQRACKKFQTSGKENLKKITVRRSSADNLSLGSSNEIRPKKEASSTTHSDDSSDEYYSRVCYNSGVKTNSHKTSDSERLLMSYGEIPPRGYAPRKKKAQKISKFLGRKRSNTFHTNRDLQKPTITDNVPQKCQSFRETREKFTESSVTGKTPPNLRQKLQNSAITIRNQDEINRKISEERILQQVISLGNLELLRNYDNNWLREVSSDSKIPFLMQAQNYTKDGTHGYKHVGKSPIRSMSEKTKKETAAERREHMQKKRSKKRLKSPDSLFATKLPTNAISNSTSTDSLNSKVVEDISKQAVPKTTLRKSLTLDSSGLRFCSEKENYKSSRKADLDGSQTNIHAPTAEVPTITIQLPKRKQRKTSCKDSNATANEEQSVTIYMPKKRSLSSEQESSISDNSVREVTKISHSDQTDEYFDKSMPCSPINNTNPILISNNGNIRLMRLVSLDNFDTPFSNNDRNIDQQPRKRKAVDEGFSGTNTPTEEMIDILSTRVNLHALSKSSTTDVEHNGSGSTAPSKYIKSPSAPQLEWRKVCAKKVSKEGAPNVRTLIAKYNKKLAESQTCKSPLSSNVSSPASTRKISTPVSGYTTPDFVPRFCSTPNTPTANSPFNSPLCFKTSNPSFSKTPPPSPLSLARSEALRIAKENFISSQSSVSNTSTNFPTIDSSQPTSPSFSKTRKADVNHPEKPPEESQTWSNLARSRDDRMSNSSMDSMNIVMLRAGENCRESRMPKKVSDIQKPDVPTADGSKLKTSKSLSSSSLFKAVLNTDFKMPTNLLKLKRSKRKKDMSTVTELCRQSLLLTTEDVKSIPTTATHKSCPSSPELKSKNVVKSSWLHRNIFRHK